MSSFVIIYIRTRTYVIQGPLSNRIISGVESSLVIPGELFSMQPSPTFEYFQMPSTCCRVTTIHIPWATFLMEPFQHLKLSSSSCCSRTGILIPWIVFQIKPLQHLKVSFIGCSLISFYNTSNKQISELYG